MILRPVILILSMVATMVNMRGQSPVEPKSLPAPDQAVEPVKPSMEKLDGNRYRIGQVTFNMKTREIRFPAKVNMTEGLLEFLVVTEAGKVHESLLSTTISPTHLNLAFTLLRYPPSKELTPLPNETGGASNRYPDVPAEVKSGSRVAIDVEWEEAGRIRRLSANDMIRHDVKTTAMPPGPWIYGGSDVFEGKFIAETTGDVIAIFVAPSAILNFSGEDNQDDNVWSPYPKRVPAQGSSVTLVISPYPKSPSKP